jgi:ADP-ribosylglycohydrolase
MAVKRERSLQQEKQRQSEAEKAREKREILLDNAATSEVVPAALALLQVAMR